MIGVLCHKTWNIFPKSFVTLKTDISLFKEYHNLVFQEFFTLDDHVSRQAELILDRLTRQGRAFGHHRDHSGAGGNRASVRGFRGSGGVPGAGDRPWRLCKVCCIEDSCGTHSRAHHSKA